MRAELTQCKTDANKKLFDSDAPLTTIFGYVALTIQRQINPSKANQADCLDAKMSFGDFSKALDSRYTNITIQWSQRDRKNNMCA